MLAEEGGSSINSVDPSHMHPLLGFWFWTYCLPMMTPTCILRKLYAMSGAASCSLSEARRCQIFAAIAASGAKGCHLTDTCL